MFKKLLSRLFPGRRSPATGGKSRHSWFDRGPPAATVDTTGKPRALIEWELAAQKPIDRTARPEDLCGIVPGMKAEQIRDHLAMLYRRHNRAAASLDAGLREEAELMLDAIVQCREKFLETKQVV
jgi:hypothetical protein